MKLFCFPIPSVQSIQQNLEEWNQLMPSVEVNFIQLPGRDDRVDEDSVSDPDVIIESLSEAILPRIKKKKFAILAHFYFVDLAFKLLQKLGENGEISSRLFVSSWIPFSYDLDICDFFGIENQNQITHSDVCNKNELVKSIAKKFEILYLIDDEDLEEKTLAPIKNDLLMILNRNCNDDYKFKCPISFFYGEKDVIFKKEDVKKEWKDFAEENKIELKIEMIKNGGRSFIVESNELQLLIEKEIADCNIKEIVKK